eukprot:CAMPEP_0183294648 /NCGR_PEP_ID=MMETSP0160_2-20130417/2900_1 /TAXON_ID=2839 ORGANISM="Odontella Sinensis, Strain Grunow 1884" /NCGR_SAMPLE_ID=MMETSP0160_2 /ASSEMBLY_ACC=CAM_ASM_000250 /LENGTH=450 /DNA_ID=CAMNT_0025456001 /DNA_START=17 /DNA_END=1369 /DNA_ORIENTATION=-
MTVSAAPSGGPRIARSLLFSLLLHTSTYFIADVQLRTAVASAFVFPPRTRISPSALRRAAVASGDFDASTSASASAPSVPSKNDRPPTDPRSVARVEKFARLPVWPAWNGVFIFFVSKIFGQEAAAKLEDAIGGRVCPNFYNPPELTSPFIMLVHHRHSFAQWDPIRYFQRAFILPEGFPAHPHRGFITVTHIMKGGFVHRDSTGVKQTYGAEGRHGGKHTQWLHTGAGILHEEMFDIEPDDGGLPFLQPSSQELYQIWLNVPASEKMTAPEIRLLGDHDGSAPVVRSEPNEKKKTTTIILAGEHMGQRGGVETRSDVTILRVVMEPGTVWAHDLPLSHRTVVLYVRTGAVSVGETLVPVHHTAYMGPRGTELVVKADEKDGADFLMMAGEPLGEPVAAQGSMVMNFSDEINRAYDDYQRGAMGIPWDHKLGDDEWAEHVQKNPSRYGKR